MAGREAPISRTVIDELLPYLRGALGLAFVIFSANSTVIFNGSDIAWLFPATTKTTIAVFSDALWYSSAFAVILFVGEVATGERYPRAYRLFLIPDVFYTVRGLLAPVCRAAIVLFGAKPGDGSYSELLGYVIGGAVAVIAGYLVARWGEELLFGKRRAKLRKAAAA